MWSANVLMLRGLQRMMQGRSADARNPTKKSFIQIVDKVARRLNHTRQVCMAHYIHPGVFALCRERPTAVLKQLDDRAGDFNAVLTELLRHT